MPLHELLGLTSSARASLAFYNTRAEIDKLIEAIDSAKKVFQRRSGSRPGASR
jgi:cysteine desulfurase/selenocysteine lyase